MKDIKRRKRQFLAGLLAFILAMLPAVSVWAETTFTITTDNGEFNVNDGENNIKTLYPDGTNTGTTSFYCSPGDTITLGVGSWCDNPYNYDFHTTFTDVDGTSNVDTTHPKQVWDTTYDNSTKTKLIVPGKDITDFANDVTGWEVTVSHAANGKLSDITFKKVITVSYKIWNEAKNDFITEKAFEWESFPDNGSLSNGKTYVLDADKVIKNNDGNDIRAVVGSGGAINLILRDGNTLTAKKGIQLAQGSELNICVEADSAGTGKIVIDGVDQNYAGIGGDYDDSKDYNDTYNAGTLSIHGGDINVLGGNGAAGIGGGVDGRQETKKYGGNGGTVNIYGGKVKAEGGRRSPGIGGGYGEDSVGDGAAVTVKGGTVETIGGTVDDDTAAYGIGSGYGGAADKQNTLSIGAGLALYAGTAANPPFVKQGPINAYDGERLQYMDIKPYTAPSPGGSGGGSYTPTPTPIPKRPLTYDPNNSIEANKST